MMGGIEKRMKMKVNDERMENNRETRKGKGEKKEEQKRRCE